MNLNDVHKSIKKHKKRKRVGRGPGSGCGKTSSRGHNGAKSRSGYSRKPVFQGGAMPLVRRVPKRGFNNKWALTVIAVNISDLERVYNDGDEVNIESLRSKSLAKSRCDELKILGDGELTKKLQVTAHRFSKSAKEKIEAAGGQVLIVPAKVSVELKKKEAKEAKAAKAAKEG
jgi:large subunit ribosomal protein L15